MQRKQPISSFGWAIKRKLAEMQVNQKTFCQRHGIPEYGLSRLIGGKGNKYRAKVAELLNLDAEE
ncbi:XRE family transcriptional regulator [Cohnella algarum]|nr:XRE family transcriptional regulator [Cohnella algarum]